MRQSANHHDRDCLQKLLDDTLTEPLASEVVEHIAECSFCLEKLESLAGAPQWWSQACSGVQAILAEPQAYLSSLIDATKTPTSVYLRGGYNESQNDQLFATDFAVDFLEPCNTPSTMGRLGNYEILEVIGSGGMGIVLKGFQRELNRYVAVKVLAPHLASSGAARRRFEREAQATAAIVHPHVMAIHAVAANAKLPYLVMPLVACESLQQRLDRIGPLDLKDMLRIGMQAASGLAAAHAQGLVHRDVKPANILLETTVDRVMLTDFGLARAVDDATLTRSGVIAGTPLYMSPEQAAGEPVDHRSDLFSLGSVLYAMCTGRSPFRAETTFGVLRRIRETEPRRIRECNSDIPQWFEQIVLKLLSKTPADRFESASSVSVLLEQCLAHIQQPTTVHLPKSIADYPVKDRAAARRKLGTLGWWLLGIALMATIVAFGIILLQERPIPKKLNEATSESSTLDPLLDWNATQLELDNAAHSIQQLDTEVKRELE